MNAYKVVRDNVNELIAKLYEMQLAFLPMDENGRKYHFYTARERFNTLHLSDETAVLNGISGIFELKTHKRGNKRKGAGLFHLALCAALTAVGALSALSLWG